MNRSDIDWPWQPLYTWNPVSGCLRGCEYCYARRIHERFNSTPYAQMTEHPERWDEPLRHKKPRAIFVGSMSDIAYWTREQVARLVDVMAATPQHTYLLLTKSPKVYIEQGWPHNVVCGATVTGENFANDITNMVMLGRVPACLFLSVEPLLGPVSIPSNLMVDLEYVIVGAQTRPTVIPKIEWIDAIRYAAPEAVHIKRKTRELLGI